MSSLHSEVFDAIHALPKPVTTDQALEAGLAQIPDAPQKREFQDWFKSNGAQLVILLNGH